MEKTLPSSVTNDRIKRKSHPKLMQAMLRAARVHKHGRFAIQSMTPVQSLECPTMAVDEYWRFYYNPQFIESISLRELTAAIMHELYHLLFRHHKRAKLVIGTTPNQAQLFHWNVACDLAVNRILAKEIDATPDGHVIMEIGHDWLTVWDDENYHRINRETDETVEYYYDALSEDNDGETNKWPIGCNPETDSSGEDSQTGSGLHGEDECAHHDSERDHLSGRGSGDPSGEDDEDRGGSGDTDISSDESPTASGSDSCGESSGASDHGDSNGSDGIEDPADRASRQFGSSSADGIARSWELGKPSDKNPGLDEEEATRVINEIAREISKSGSQTGDLVAWADEEVRTRLNVKRLILNMVRSFAEQTDGYDDYSYGRPNRRQAMSGFIKPANVSNVPRIICCLDTSYSMDKEDYAKAKSVINSIFTQLGVNQGLKIIMGDTEVKRREVAWKTFRKMELHGGGGTDVGVLLHDASQQTPAPHVIMAFTDGETPWPEQKLNVPVIAVITRKKHTLESSGYECPAWIKSVYI